MMDKRCQIVVDISDEEVRLRQMYKRGEIKVV